MQRRDLFCGLLSRRICLKEVLGLPQRIAHVNYVGAIGVVKEPMRGVPVQFTWAGNGVFGTVNSCRYPTTLSQEQGKGVDGR